MTCGEAIRLAPDTRHIPATSQAWRHARPASLLPEPAGLHRGREAPAARTTAGRGAAARSDRTRPASWLAAPRDLLGLQTAGEPDRVFYERQECTFEYDPHSCGTNQTSAA